MATVGPTGVTVDVIEETSETAAVDTADTAAGSTATAPLGASGTYALVVEVAPGATIGFGAAGDRSLVAGRYVYIGSAFGPGGLGRVRRHAEVAAGERDVRHWHVDHLLGHPNARLTRAVVAPRADCECALAARFEESAADPVAGLGASDCDCATHLFVADDAVSTVRTAFRAVR